MFSLIQSIYQPILILFSVLLISDYIKDQEILIPIIRSASKKIKNRRLLLFIFVNILGFLPVPDRIILACGLLDSLQDKTKDNKKMGFLAYLSTHHYYLWSPLEKSIIIVIGVAGISYFSFLKLMLPAIITYSILLLITYFVFVRDSDLHFNFENLKSTISVSKNQFILHGVNLTISLILAFELRSYTLFFVSYVVGLTLINYSQTLRSLRKIDYKMIFYVTLLLIGTHYIKLYGTPLFKELAKHNNYLYIALAAEFICSWILGSSSRDAALAAVGITVFGNQYLPLFYITDYAGYFISPAHKCTVISKLYFKIPVFYFYGILALFISIVVSSIVIFN